MKLLKFDMSKTANFFNLKFLAIMKILLPGRLFTIFVSLFPLFKLIYRYGKNIHSLIGIRVILKFKSRKMTLLRHLLIIYIFYLADVRVDENTEFHKICKKRFLGQK